MRTYRKYAAVTLLLYAAYVTAMCPCPQINKCHSSEFLGAVGAAVALCTLDW
jgi:hypothetical protein